MEKLPWNPSKDVIRVSANNLGIDIDRAIYTAMAIDYSRQSTEQTKKNDIVRLGMCNVSMGCLKLSAINVSHVKNLMN